MSFLLLDADIIMYRAALSAEQEVDWGDDIWSLQTDLKDAKAAFKTQVDVIRERLGVDKYLCCLSDHSSNFRKKVFPDYKSGRKKTRKPVGYVALCSWVEENHDTLRKPSLEADDVMGILATKPDNVGKCIVVSDDKDLKTIPGELYRPTSDERQTLTQEEAEKYFLMQCLTGDSTDSYSGVPGIGPKKAEAILGTRPAWSSVEQAYIKAGLTRDDAITQARLARILRWSDWDQEKGEVKLWTP